MLGVCLAYVGPLGPPKLEYADIRPTYAQHTPNMRPHTRTYAKYTRISGVCLAYVWAAWILDQVLKELIGR